MQSTELSASFFMPILQSSFDMVYLFICFIPFTCNNIISKIPIKKQAKKYRAVLNSDIFKKISDNADFIHNFLGLIPHKSKTLDRKFCGVSFVPNFTF